jgi:hypothetical protein
MPINREMSDTAVRDPMYERFEEKLARDNGPSYETYAQYTQRFLLQSLEQTIATTRAHLLRLSSSSPSPSSESLISVNDDHQSAAKRRRVPIMPATTTLTTPVDDVTIPTPSTRSSSSSSDSGGHDNNNSGMICVDLLRSLISFIENYRSSTYQDMDSGESMPGKPNSHTSHIVVGRLPSLIVEADDLLIQLMTHYITQNDIISGGVIDSIFDTSMLHYLPLLVNRVSTPSYNPLSGSAFRVLQMQYERVWPGDFVGFSTNFVHLIDYGLDLGEYVTIPHDGDNGIHHTCISCLCHHHPQMQPSRNIIYTTHPSRVPISQQPSLLSSNHNKDDRNTNSNGQEGTMVNLLRQYAAKLPNEANPLPATSAKINYNRDHYYERVNEFWSACRHRWISHLTRVHTLVNTNTPLLVTLTPIVMAYLDMIHPPSPIS